MEEFFKGIYYCSKCNKILKDKDTNQMNEEEDEKRKRRDIIEDYKENMRKRYSLNGLDIYDLDKSNISSNQTEIQEDYDSEIFDVISTILDEEIPIESVFTISQSTEEFEPFQEEWDDLTLTEKIQVNWSSELYNICRRAKGLYNFALFICRKIYFLHKKNPNVSWDDFLTIRENIMPEPSVKDYTQKRQKLLETFDKLQNIF